MPRIIRGFVRREQGAATLEAALWVPVMLLVMLLAVDAIFVAMNHARLQRVVDEGSRAFSVGQVQTCGELEDLLTARLARMVPDAVVSCATDGTYVTASLAVSAGDLDLSGSSGMLDGLTIRARSEMTAMNGVPGSSAGTGPDDGAQTGPGNSGKSNGKSR